LSAGLSISSSSLRRVTPSRRIGRSSRAARRIDLSEIVKAAVARPAEQRALDDQYWLLDLGVVAGRRGRAGKIAVP
jgi:hypothetical protein